MKSNTTQIVQDSQWGNSPVIKYTNISAVKHVNSYIKTGKDK